MESDTLASSPGAPLDATGPHSEALPDASSALGRRSFLQWISIACGALIAGIVGAPVVRAAIAPITAAPPPDDWVKVADDTALLDIGVPVRLDFMKEQKDAWVETTAMNSVWLFTEDGEKFKAYNGHCTHLGCSYVFDKARGNFICPCHHGQFDVKTGAVLAGPPPRPLDELEVQIRDAAVYVKYRDFRLGVPERVEA